MMSKSIHGKVLREGDKVVAIAGNEKGKSGVIRARFGDRLLIQGLNVRKKHVRKTQESPQGGVVEKEMPIHASNVMACDDQGNGVKLKVRINDQGVKELYYKDKKSGQEVFYRSMKKSK